MIPPDKSDASVSSDSGCPPDERLRQSIEGRGDASDTAGLVAHLDQCDACQHRLRSLVASPEVWSTATRNLRESAAEESDGLTSVIARLQTRIFGADDTRMSCAPNAVCEFLRPCSTPGRLGRLGPYEVVETLGRGGMGIVFKAVDPALARTVAIKVLASPPAFSADARERFRREARAVAAVRSEHVVLIHAVEESAEPPYLVMEYVEGESLQERIDRSGPMEIGEIVRIGAQIARGLAAAHGQGLIHRDVKPANILLESGTGRVKITDFGLARAVDDPGLTQAGVVTGTPEYMAPEQTGDGPIDHRVDLFSLGSVLYATCTGRSPFRAEGSLAVLRRMREESPPAIGWLRPEAPRALIEIIERLHRKDPQARYATAFEVAEALDALAARLADAQSANTFRPTTEEDDSMASRWFYRVFDQELGPVGFQDLVELIRAGTLTEGDRVRRELSEEWQAARDVIGLFRAADAVRSEPERRSQQTGGTQAAASGRTSAAAAATRLPAPAPVEPAAAARSRRVPVRALLGASGGVALAVVVVLAVWSGRRERFPKPQQPKANQVSRDAFERARPRSATPSVPGLEQQVPRPVPGLENVEPIYAPFLTPDMLTIVYTAMPAPARTYDLYIADRDNVSEPFHAPKRIEATVTPATESYPTLSPDGLDLVFVRAVDHPQVFRMFHCTRATRSSEFGTPAPYSILGLDAGTQSVERPQFLDPRRLAYCIEDFQPRGRDVFMTQRAGAKQSFGSPRKVSLRNRAPPYFYFMENDLRTYFSVDEGLFVRIRQNKTGMEGQDILIVGAKESGPFEGSLWVAPQEDVVFYVSAGRGEKVGSRRRLWMMRF
jgi:serine/threonine protein kinase